MNAARRYPWILPALLAGAAYSVIGRVSAGTREGRLAAWALSFIVYAVHIWYEDRRLRNVPLTTAWHVAAGVAIGGFGVAVGAMIHKWSATSAIEVRWLLALVLFPAFTALPAFIVAFGVATIARRVFIPSERSPSSVIPSQRSERGDLP